MRGQRCFRRGVKQRTAENNNCWFCFLKDAKTIWRRENESDNWKREFWKKCIFFNSASGREPLTISQHSSPLSSNIPTLLLLLPLFLLGSPSPVFRAHSPPTCVVSHPPPPSLSPHCQSRQIQQQVLRRGGKERG